MLRHDRHEIWLGWHHLGQGYAPLSEPLLLAIIHAPTFKVACWLYELQSTLEGLQRRIGRKDEYIEDVHFGTMYYDPVENSNDWTGKYYPSKEEALKSFKP